MSSPITAVSAANRTARRTAIPALIVEQLNLHTGDRLAWTWTGPSTVEIRVLTGMPQPTTTTKSAK